MNDNLKILFLCTGNSCRSQMAEGWCRQLKGGEIAAFSAGTAPQGLNPHAVRVMAEAGVDVSGQRSQHIDAFKDTSLDAVVTVCGDAQENCPVFPGPHKVFHAGFPDPPKMAAELAAQGASEEEQLDCYRQVRDQIRDYILTLPEALQLRPEEIRAQVRARYGGIAVAGGSCCAAPGCCSQPLGNPATSASVGYAAEEMAAVPDGANMRLGCGNPQAIAELKPGETVLDLGSGGGFDCFLAARQVGAAGRVIGVDMTPEMISKARANARQGGFANVEFRLGEIEHLPVADSSADVIMSNCVINLSPDKAQVFAEIFRALRPGGRLAVSDVVAIAPLPPELRASTEAYTCCAAGAAPVAEIKAMLKQAGFSAVTVEIKEESRAFIKDWLPGSGIENYVRSALITAGKS